MAKPPSKEPPKHLHSSDLRGVVQLTTQAIGKVLVLIHGLCMNALQWHSQQDGQAVDQGAALADKLGCPRAWPATR